jgi:RimJ/RimL family protein N-acetyltransferase
MDLVIETPRLIIRPWKKSPEDIGAYLQLASDVGYTCFSLPGQFVLDAKNAEDRLQDRIDLFESHKIGKFLVLDRTNREVIGTCGLGAYELDEQEEIELGFRLRLKFWGKGYATEAAQAVLGYGFRSLGLKRIIAFAIPQNLASIRVIEKLGFSFERDFIHAEIPHKLFSLKTNV